MKFKVDFNHIFFDRYTLPYEEKEELTKYIIEKALDERYIPFSFNGSLLETEISGLENEMSFYKVIDTLKREFFIIIEKAEEIKSDDRVSLIDNIEAYIRKMFVYETFSVQEICDVYNIKRSALDNIFVKTYDMTAKQYLKELRVNKARALIEQGEKVSDAAQVCGFGSVKTMQRAFKDVYNITPAQSRTHLTENL